MNQPTPTATTHTTEGNPAMYAPAVIPHTLADTYAGIFWAAANRIASTPHSPDVLTNAITAAAPKPHHVRTIEQLAVNRAQKLHPTAINPTTRRPAGPGGKTDSPACKPGPSSPPSPSNIAITKTPKKDSPQAPGNRPKHSNKKDKKTAQTR